MSDTNCHSGDNEIVQKLVQKFITSNIIDLILSLSLSLSDSDLPLFQSLCLTLICLFANLNCLKSITLNYDLEIWKLGILKYRVI